LDIRLTLLDGFELTCGGKPVPLPRSSQRVVAFLALHDRPLLRLYVAGVLWLDSSEERSCANLRSALWRLRGPKTQIVEASATHVRLGREVVVDVRSLVSAARALLDPKVLDEELAPDGTTLEGDLLPDWYEDWVEEERERLLQLRVHALESLADRLARAGRYGQAVEAGLAAIRADPLRESAHRALIRVHLAEGNPGAALRHYRAFQARMEDELGLAPSPRMEELVRGIA
jgi:DNA-binding SARP family transcriptional activator